MPVLRLWPIGRITTADRPRTEFAYLRTAALSTGRIVPKARVHISPGDRGFTHGDGVYEVIRCYEGRLFRPEQHLRRLERSIEAVAIQLTGVSELLPVCRELIQRNHLDAVDATVYIQVTRGACERMHGLSPPNLTPTVYIETSPLEKVEGREAGVMAVTAPDIRWHRCDIKSVCLLPNVLARLHASAQGVHEAIFIRDGVITEGTHTNVFGVRNGAVITHPADHNILAGITRKTVLQLCANLGINVQQKAIPESALGGLDELFLACTTGEVIPVCSVDGRSMKTGAPGEVTRSLQQAFRQLVAGELGNSLG